MCAAPNGDVLAMDVVGGDRLRCNGNFLQIRGRMLVDRARVCIRLPEGALWQCLLPDVFGCHDRLGQTRGSLLDAANDAVGQFADCRLRPVERPEACHCIGIVEVPGVLRKPDEIADGRIGRPGTTKCRTK